MIGEVKWKGEPWRGVLEPKKNRAHTVASATFRIIILFRARSWISKKWESWLPNGPSSGSHLHKQGLTLETHRETGALFFWKTRLEFAHQHLVPEARAGGWWPLSLPCKQQQCCLWECSPGFPYYCPSYRLQLSPDRTPVGHRLVIENVLLITMNVSLSAETKEPQTQGKFRTLPSSAGSRL